MAEAGAGAGLGRPRYGVIVLAAGSSSRMGAGAHKLLLPLGGKPLVAYAVAAACESMADPVVVVLGRAADELRSALPPGRYHAVVNPEYATGMASSLRVGLRALRAISNHDTREPGASTAGALIALADQPLAGPDLFDALLRAAAETPAAIVAPRFGDRRGNPVVFPVSLFAELEKVAGDEGGRGVIARHPALLRAIDWPDPRAALDVDRPGDYERVVSLLGGGAATSSSED